MSIRMANQIAELEKEVQRLRLQIAQNDNALTELKLLMESKPKRTPRKKAE